jgi:HK97 family phage major capsid protein
MELKNMTIEDLEARKLAIKDELEADGADLDALEAEVRAINAELESRKAEETKKAEIRDAVAAGAGETVKTFKKTEERKTMTIEEIRSSKEYINAYANYVKTGRDEECRSIISENAPEGTTGSGPVPVPVFVEAGVKTAWENDPIMSRVRRTFLPGNLKVTFERSASDASEHEEGAQHPNEEEILLGNIEITPKNIKKWITITDEAMAMGGEEFLRYIYDEITYKIVRKAAALAIQDVINAPASHTAGAVGVPVVAQAPGVVTIPTAAAHLSDEATNVVVVMNRLTEVEFLSAAAAGSYAIDPFAGLPRLYTSALKAYSAASTGETYAIVGDLQAIQFNYPEGDDVVLKYDDLSLAEDDLVKIVGRQYAAHGVTAPGRLVKVTKA